MDINEGFLISKGFEPKPFLVRFGCVRYFERFLIKEHEFFMFVGEGVWIKYVHEDGELAPVQNGG
jgi:hypothetical protein